MRKTIDSPPPDGVGAGPASRKPMLDAKFSSNLPPEVIEAWRGGHKIEAIRRLRKIAGLELAQAKAAIDQLDGRHAGSSGQRTAMQALRPDGLAPGEVPRPKASPGVAVLIVLAVVGLWLYWIFAG